MKQTKKKKTFIRYFDYNKKMTYNDWGVTAKGYTRNEEHSIIIW